MKIVSLHPACTEWVAAFGALEDLVGRSHACDYPEQVRRVPSVTRPVSVPSSRGGAKRDGSAPSVVNEQLIAALEPDVILTSDGVSARGLGEVSTRFVRSPELFRLNPVTFKEVLDGALRLGKTIGRLREAMRYIGETEKNLLTLQRRVAPDLDASAPPTILCVEGAEPIRLSGRWVLDLVELAGGEMINDRAAEGDWNEIASADPDVLAVIPSAGDVGVAKQLAERLSRMAGWHGLRAQKSDRVFAFDGVLFHRPGPRLYRAVELLAVALHPGQALIRPREDEMVRIRT